ncbi:PH domain-like protein [Hymenopellis radicata]|nr:PH domain-like protein [Hymenopellis radicata]
MPHQRAPSQTSTSQNGNSKSRPPKTTRPVSAGPLPPNQKPDFGMSPTSRYDHNLKVLRRRDPSITSIFDQFSHVCVYHFNINTNKWEKLGYEGSMFLYERNEYPPYGFYVLNRQGMDDYIQRMQLMTT